MRLFRAKHLCCFSGTTLPTTVERLPHRRTISSIVSGITSHLSDSVNRLTRDMWLEQDKFVTEPRRKVDPVRSSSDTLAERLQKQRNIKSKVVPTSITVDESRQYLEFTWPAVPATPLTSATEEKQPLQAPREHRSRALAEYLRAYSTSTDSMLASNGSIVIYGRRGITIKDLIPIGNYALRIVFSDGHSGGIYSYEYLYYLTSSEDKYRLMREYIKELRARRKSRDPPRKRAPSQKYDHLKKSKEDESKN